MNMLAFFPLGVVGPWQVVIIALVILLLFGGKKIPELMKSFKEGMNEVEKQIGDIEQDMNAPAKSPDKIEKKEEYQK